MIHLCREERSEEKEKKEANEPLLKFSTELEASNCQWHTQCDTDSKEENSNEKEEEEKKFSGEFFFSHLFCFLILLCPEVFFPFQPQSL